MKVLLKFLAANFYLSLVKVCLCIVTSEVYNLKFQRHYLPYDLKQLSNSHELLFKF